MAKQPASSSNTLEDVVCFGCGCLCDDLRLNRSDKHWSAASLDCQLGQQWVAQLPMSCDLASRLDGKECSSDEAVERAAELLSAARAPLVCGLKGVATDAQRYAFAIADQLRGRVDWTTAAADVAGVLAMQSVGTQAATLGEVAQRADLVVFWQCDPATTHPRHFERYSLTRSSRWLPNGRQDRTVVCIGSADTPTAEGADIAIVGSPEQSLDQLQQLRAALAGNAAVDVDDCWKDLARRISESRYVAFFYGPQLQQQGEAALTQLTLLAQQAPTRVVACGLGAGDNAAGAENVLAWQTGYPAAVSFARGWPDYGPQEFTTERLLTRGECDAVLVVSSNGLAGLSDVAMDALAALPSVVLSDGNAVDLSPNVELPAAPLGATRGGSAYRCDGIALPLRNALCQGPSHAEVLKPLLARLNVAPPLVAPGSAGGLS